MRSIHFVFVVTLASVLTACGARIDDSIPSNLIDQQRLSTSNVTGSNPTTTTPTPVSPTPTPSATPVVQAKRCQDAIEKSPAFGDCEKVKPTCVDSAIVSCTPRAADCLFEDTYIKNGAVVNGYTERLAQLCTTVRLTCIDGVLKTSVIGLLGPIYSNLTAPVYRSCKILKNNPNDCIYRFRSWADGSMTVLGRCSAGKLYPTMNGVQSATSLCELPNREPVTELGAFGAACDGRFD